jgi:hypothetical protein
MKVVAVGSCSCSCSIVRSVRGCEVVLEPTPEAIRTFNRSHAKRIGLFHVTC